MTRKIIALIGLALLAGCSGGGDSPAPNSSSSPAQPDFLVATSQGLWRGLPNGQGGIVFAQSNFIQQDLSFSGSQVFYERLKGPNTGGPFDDTDIWTVKSDGTGHRAAVNTTDHEELLRSAGPWMVYMKRFLRNGLIDHEFWSLHENGTQHLVVEENGAIVQTDFFADRMLFVTETYLYSISLTGGNRIPYGSAGNNDVILNGAHVVGSFVVYPIGDFSGNVSQLFTIPVAGGTATPIETDQFYSYVVRTLGTRVLYHRCTPARVCDIVSIEANGTGKVVLADQPANEAVQGVTTNQAIIRRNQTGNDHLLAVPVTGGQERLLMTMTDNEFVETMVGDTIIIRRPTGTWTLDLNGNLKQIGTKPGLDFFRVVGDSICSDFGEIWCLPIDGSRAEVRIDRNGKFLGVL